MSPPPPAKLRAMSDKDLEAAHDEQAKNTGVALDYYVEELDRRTQERDAQAMRELAEAANTLSRRAIWLTVASTALSGIAVLVAVIALILGR